MKMKKILNTEKMKKRGNISVLKLSKSDSVINNRILDLKHDFCCFQSRLRTRSYSHDSIFLSEHHQSNSEPPRAISQKNFIGKFEALQIKIQKQKTHLGPLPLALPIKQNEDFHHPTEVLTLSEHLPHKSHLKSSSQGSLPHTISTTMPTFHFPARSQGVDFSTLPQFITCLDSSAARHRMSIKPRNKRASTKSRRTSTSDRNRFQSENVIILEQPVFESKEENVIAVTKEMPQVHSYSSQLIRPVKGLTTPLIKSQCPTSHLKLLVGAYDCHPYMKSQCKGKEEPAVNTSVDVGSKPILMSAEGVLSKCPDLAVPLSRDENEDCLYISQFKGVEGSAVSVGSSVYTPCLISLGTEQSQPTTDTMPTHFTRNELNTTQKDLQEHYLQGQPLTPLSLQRNTSPFDSKFKDKHIHQISSVSLSSKEDGLQEATTQQQSLSFSVSSDRSHEWQRTGSFTGYMEHEGGQREHVFSLIKSSSNLKAQDLQKNAQVSVIWKDSSKAGVNSSPAVSTKPTDLISTASAGQERGDSPVTKPKYMTVETQEEDEEAHGENKGLKMSKAIKEQKEEGSAPEVKQHTTSQSEINFKQNTTEARSLNTSWFPQSTIAIAVVQNTNKVGPVKDTCKVIRNPSCYNPEHIIPAESVVFSSIRPQSARWDEERAGLITFPDLQASPQLPGSCTNIKSMPVCTMEGSLQQTSAKDSIQTSTELSWMSMAREKTRSLQQLFTNTMNDLAGLQTATRPAASPKTQKPSQSSTGPVRPKQQIPSAQPSVCPLETQLTTVQASITATHPMQQPNLRSSISPAQLTIDQSGGVHVSSKQTLSPTSQIQQTDFSARPGQITTNLATKPLQIPQFNPHLMHAAQQQFAQMSVHHTHPVQQSLPQSMTNPQESQYVCLPLRPKLTPHQPAHQSHSPVLQPRPHREHLSPLPLEKLDWTSMLHEKSSAETQARYTGGLGSKNLLSKQWHHQKPNTVKVVGQNSTQDSQTDQSLDEFLSISSQFTELAVCPGPMRLDRDDKCQKKTLPQSSSSSSRLQSNSDSRQPSWMELAKRKSLAWSDKNMD